MACIFPKNSIGKECMLEKKIHVESNSFKFQSKRRVRNAIFITQIHFDGTTLNKHGIFLFYLRVIIQLMENPIISFYSFRCWVTFWKIRARFSWCTGLNMQHFMFSLLSQSIIDVVRKKTLQVSILLLFFSATSEKRKTEKFSCVMEKNPHNLITHSVDKFIIYKCNERIYLLSVIDSLVQFSCIHRKPY